MCYRYCINKISVFYLLIIDIGSGVEQSTVGVGLGNDWSSHLRTQNVAIF